MSRSSSVCVPRGRFSDLCPPLGGVRDYALLSFSSVSDRLVARGLPPALAGDSAWLGVVAWPGRAKAVLRVWLRLYGPQIAQRPGLRARVGRDAPLIALKG